MLEFQEKRQVKKFMYSRITLAFLLIILFFLLKGVWGVYQKQQFTADNLNKATNDLKNLQEREKTLSTQIDWLKTTNGREQEIREKYGLIKPGEEVIIIIDKNDNSDLDDLSNVPGFWQKLRLWLQ